MTDNQQNWIEPEVLTGKPLVAAIFGTQPDEHSWRLMQRKLYRLVHDHGLPAFRLNGRQLAARPRTLREWIEARERAGLRLGKAA